MATTHPAHPRTAARQLPVRLLDKYFYFAMSLLVAAVVIYGFSHTISGNLFHPAVPRPVLLWFHAACFSAWVAFYIFQSLLVRTHNVRMHRVTGWFGAALGAAMVVLGFWIAVVMNRFDAHILHQTDAYPFLIVPFLDIAPFGVLFTLAIVWRKKPELHRRLVLVATCLLTNAAFGRFPFNFPPPIYSAWGVDALILLGVIRDLIVNRRIHRVYLYSLPALFACQWIAGYVYSHQPHFWMRIAHSILD